VWGGFYFKRGDNWRLCLGWLALTFIPRDLDFLAADLAEWREEADLRPLAAWREEDDTGTSSMTILHTLGGCRWARMRVENALWQRGRASLGRVPFDPDDLGRCIRLLDIFPAWRERLGEVAAKYPAWATLVRHWPEMEALYREELPEHAGTAPQLLARMRGLLEGQDEARVDLSGLDGDREARSGPYFEALDAVLDVMLDCHEELPSKLYVTIPGEVTTLLWSRDGEEPSVEKAIRNAQARAEEEENPWLSL
jgi:hypothetical protein